MVLPQTQPVGAPRRKPVALAWAGVVIGLVIVFLSAPTLIRFVTTLLFEKTIASNEAGATNALLEIRASLNKYRQIHGGYPASLNDVVREGLLAREWAAKVIHNYEFEYASRKPLPQPASATGLYTEFTAVARPTRFLPGTRTIVLTERGEIGIYDSTKENARVESIIKAPDDWEPRKDPGS